MDHVAVALQVVGLVALIAAGFLLAVWVGWFVFGAFSLGVGLYIEREETADARVEQDT